jgi:hypothetical protein
VICNTYCNTPWCYKFIYIFQVVMAVFWFVTPNCTPMCLYIIGGHQALNLIIIYLVLQCYIYINSSKVYRNIKESCNTMSCYKVLQGVTDMNLLGISLNANEVF